MKNMLALSQERFSARKFTSEAVSQEDLDYIMECVRMAPSAVNKQPWKWLIVRSDEAKQKLQVCGGKLGEKIRRKGSWRHRCGYRYRTSLPGCHRKRIGHLLGLQL